MRGLLIVVVAETVVWLAAASIASATGALLTAIVGVAVTLGVGSARRLDPLAISLSLGALLVVGATARLALPLPAAQLHVTGLTLHDDQRQHWSSSGGRYSSRVEHTASFATADGFPGLGWVVDPGQVNTGRQGLLRLPWGARSTLPASLEAEPLWELTDEPETLQRERLSRALWATAVFPTALLLVRLVAHLRGRRRS